MKRILSCLALTTVLFCSGVYLFTETAAMAQTTPSTGTTAKKKHRKFGLKKAKGADTASKTQKKIS